jgi:hypothetical protein
MTDGKLTSIAINQIQADRQNDINANQNQIQLPEGTDNVCEQKTLQNREDDNACRSCF